MPEKLQMGIDMRQIIETAYAKINLSLDVTGTREDGYHLVQMIMQTIDLYDTLTFETRDENLQEMSIILTSDIEGLSLGDDNLICRAVRLMAGEYGLHTDIKISLVKRIPMAAGMAGGSTDAAAAMRAVRDLFVPEVSDEELERLAVKIGADVPYCIRGGTQLCEGIGEILTVLPSAPQCGLAIVKPLEGVSTEGVYKAYDALKKIDHPDVLAQMRAIEEGNLDALVKNCGNVLELVTGSRQPMIGQIETYMQSRGAMVAQMTGSGPTVFAIFETAAEAEAAVQAFCEQQISAACYAKVSSFIN